MWLKANQMKNRLCMLSKMCEYFMPEVCLWGECNQMNNNEQSNEKWERGREKKNKEKGEKRDRRSNDWDCDRDKDAKKE